jgi:hypothetical protein
MDDAHWGVESVTVLDPSARIVTTVCEGNPHRVLG